ncbi:MAG: hypothetical protein ACREPQ_05645 [Rhodanobacter sp.]
MQAICFIALLSLFVTMPAVMGATPPTSAPLNTPQSPKPIKSPTDSPIKSAQALARYLHDTPALASPLDQLSPGAKKRFLSSLQFGENGLGGFDPTDLEAELTNEEIHRVLALFGAQDYAANLHGVQSGARTAHAPACTVPIGCPESRIERSFNNFYALSESSLTDVTQQLKSRQLIRRYRELFAGEQSRNKLEAMSDSDLKLLYRAATTASFESHDATFLPDMTLDLDELQRRGLATDNDVVQLHSMQVAARQFAAADALAIEYPSSRLQVLPVLQDLVPPHHDGPSVLTVNTDGRHMTRNAFDLRAQVQIVVVAGCHFAADAARYIEADATLDRIFKQHALWLGSQAENVDDVLHWNREHTSQPMNIAWRDSDWPALGSWAMPTFYIFEHGKLVNQFSGWSNEITPRQLRTALKQAGLLR